MVIFEKGVTQKREGVKPLFLYNENNRNHLIEGQEVGI